METGGLRGDTGSLKCEVDELFATGHSQDDDCVEKEEVKERGHPRGAPREEERVARPRRSPHRPRRPGRCRAAVSPRAPAGPGAGSSARAPQWTASNCAAPCARKSSQPYRVKQNIARHRTRPARQAHDRRRPRVPAVRCQQRPLVPAPEHVVPRRAMPEAAQQHRDHQVRVCAPLAQPVARPAGCRGTRAATSRG